ncbi:hypothetical protein Tco_1305928, partial [Tanacetum coccineum]
PFEENDNLFDLECKTNDWKTILYDAPIDEAEYFDPRDDIDEIDAFLAMEVSTNIEEGYYDSEGDVFYLEILLSDDTTHNLFPKSLENFHASPNTIIESLPTFPILVKDSESLREEINIILGPDDSIPTGIDSDFDSEEDIIFLDNLCNDDISLLEYEHFTFDIEPDVPVINNFDELNEDECFDPGGDEINVEDDDSFIFIIRTFLPFLTYPVDSPLLLSTGSEDTIYDPGIST